MSTLSTSDCAYLVSLLLDVVHPVLHAVEGRFVGDVVDHDDPVSAVVVVAGDRLEALLAGRVPLMS